MLLITILVLTVASTIALSLIGRATLDLSMSNQLAESSRAFNAAEAGIEEALRSGSTTTQVLTPGVTYNVTVTSIGGTGGLYVMQHKTLKDVTETLWLVNHNDDGSINETPFYTASTLDVCWSKETLTPALVVSVLYKEGVDGTYKTARLALDPSAASRGNSFEVPPVVTSGCGSTNNYLKQISFVDLGITLLGVNRDTLLALRIRPEYADTSISIDPGANALPKQGNRIESVGTTGTGIARKVIVYQQYRAPASIFDSVIFSQSSFGH